MATNPKVFREYIGAMWSGVQFTDVPINPNVPVHFILSFAIDSTTSGPATPTDGKFSTFWDPNNFGPSQVASIKKNHPNVKVALSLGGDTVTVNGFAAVPAVFKPVSVVSWVANAVSTLTEIIKRYGLDGIDIDYEHFNADPNTFAECIGGLLMALKQSNVISFASIAPYEDETVQPYYKALWGRYANYIDYVNFQFYAAPAGTTVDQFIASYNRQRSTNYPGGNILVSCLSDGATGLRPDNGFFQACQQLKNNGELHGIFMWCADTTKRMANGFPYERRSQDMLANA